jgi:head-tail adaptor
MTLSPEDLAYMRETAAESRPTQGTLKRRVTTRSASGGQVTTWDAGEPVDARVDGSPDKVPESVGARLEGGTAVKITLDRVRDVRSGDRFDVSATEGYEFVSDGTPDEWSTAQVVWARRYLHPARA